MPLKLKVLNIEDNPADSELAERELARAGYDVNWRRVDKLEQVSKEITSDPPDLVLSDFKMPGFDGFEALKLVRATLPDVPFVLLTGSLNEETAVEVIKAGADDYVIKQHLVRLVPAVKSAINKWELEKERKQAEQKLKEKMLELEQFYNLAVGRELKMIELEKDVDRKKKYVEDMSEQISRTEQKLKSSELKFKDLVENLNDVVFSVDTQGKVIYITPAVGSFGYTPEEITGNRFSDYIHPDDLPGLQDSFEKTLLGKLNPHEFRIRGKDGAYHYVRSSSRPMLQDGKLFGLTGVMLNIDLMHEMTERLKDYENKFRIIAENSFDVIYILDKEGVVTYLSPSIERHSGFKPEELIGQDFHRFVPDTEAEKFAAAFGRAVQERRQAIFRSEIIKKDGARARVEAVISPFFEKDRLAGFQGVVRNLDLVK